MKKIFSLIMLFAATSFALTSCNSDTDEEAGGTAVQNMAGVWEVTYEAINEDGTVFDPDWNGGVSQLYTYNLADNLPTKMYVDDRKNLYGFKFVVDVDYNNQTFVCNSDDYIVENGKIVKNGGLNIHGKPIDSIDFYLTITNDAYATKYGFKKYHVYGTRYTGFYE